MTTARAGFSTMLAAAWLMIAAPAAPAQQGESWPFQPPEDRFAASALVDLRSLNEAKSGATGFVRVAPDGEGFVRGDGQPIRFWALGSDIYRSKDPTAMDRHCRFLAKRGVNMIRLHATVADAREGAKVTDVNEEEIAGIFRFIQAAKDNGIYVTISPYYGHHPTPKSWGIAGYKPDQQPWGALFLDPVMQEGYRAWTRELYTRTNPHTGLAIKDDPTVAILQVHNEDSLFFWTAQALPPEQVARLTTAFKEWLIHEYGSFEKSTSGWQGAAADGDDLAAGKLGWLSTWHLTQPWDGGMARRVRDQTQFLARFQRRFYEEMGHYLRDELGCKQVLNATNWRTASDARLKDIERWTYAALDADAENEYYGSDTQHVGENNGYRIDPGHYLVDASCLKKPLELTTNFKVAVGHPFLVTETSWKHPNRYQAEGPFLVAAYQSLGGVDAVYWFSADETTWHLDPRRMFWKVGDSYALSKWSCSTPMLLGMFPANALMFRRGDLEVAPVVVHEERSLDEMWDRGDATIDDDEMYGAPGDVSAELGSPRRPDGRVSRAAYLVGRVESVRGGDPSRTRVSDLAPFLDGRRGTIRSATRQLTWNHRAGVCTIDAPRAQGVAGFLREGGGRYALKDVTIESRDDYATIQAVSLDGRPLAASRSVLVQVGTTARLTGWKTEHATFEFDKKPVEGERIVATGEPPWRIASVQARLTVRNPALREAMTLDANFEPVRTLDVKRSGGGLVLELPPDAMYVLLRDGGRSGGGAR